MKAILDRANLAYYSYIAHLLNFVYLRLVLDLFIYLQTIFTINVMTTDSLYVTIFWVTN